jgi:hypothetical protein
LILVRSSCGEMKNINDKKTHSWQMIRWFVFPTRNHTDVYIIHSRLFNSKPFPIKPLGGYTFGEIPQNLDWLSLSFNERHCRRYTHNYPINVYADKC